MSMLVDQSVFQCVRHHDDGKALLSLSLSTLEWRVMAEAV